MTSSWPEAGTTGSSPRRTWPAPDCPCSSSSAGPGRRRRRVDAAVQRARGRRFSPYSRFVSLPPRLVGDLDLHVELLPRPTTPYAGSPDDHDAWREFHADVADLAHVVAPTLLEPLPIERDVRDKVDTGIWRDFVTNPLGATLEERFGDDAVRGVAASDGADRASRRRWTTRRSPRTAASSTRRSATGLASGARRRHGRRLRSPRPASPRRRRGDPHRRRRQRDPGRRRRRRGHLPRRHVRPTPSAPGSRSPTSRHGCCRSCSARPTTRRPSRTAPS